MFKNKNAKGRQDLQILVRKTSKESKQNKKSSLKTFIQDKTGRKAEQSKKLLVSSNLKASNSRRRSSSNKKVQYPTEPCQLSVCIEDFSINPLTVSPKQLLQSPDRRKNTQISNVCGTCQATQFLYKEEISLLRQYCDYVKDQNKAIRQQHNKLKVTCSCAKKDAKIIFESTGITTEQFLEFQSIQTMTVLTASNINDVQTSSKMQREQNNSLVQQLKSAHAIIQALTDEIKSLTLKYESICLQIESKTVQFQAKQVTNKQTVTDLSLCFIEQITAEKQRLQTENHRFLQEKQQIEEMCHEMISQQLSGIGFGSSIQLIKRWITRKLQIDTKPLQEEIDLLKELFESQKRRNEQKQGCLQKILLEAQKTIKSLMEQLRSSKKQAKEHFMTNLEKQRSLIGFKSVFECRQQETSSQSSRRF